jgi:hypothetical protein
MGPTCAVYLPGEVDDECLEALDRLLTDLADEVVRTRRGQVFELSIDRQLFHLAVQATDETLHDCEDSLLAVDLLPEDAPYRIVISAPTTTPAADAILRSLSTAIVGLLGGRATEPVK